MKGLGFRVSGLGSVLYRDKDTLYLSLYTKSEALADRNPDMGSPLPCGPFLL